MKMADDTIAQFEQQAADMAREAREAYSKGFADAMKKVEEFISSMRFGDAGTLPAPTEQTGTPVTAKGAGEPRKRRLRRKPGKQYRPRMTRHAVKKELERAYAAIDPHSAGATDIQDIIFEKYGEELARSSIVRGINDLTEEGILQEIAGTKKWRLAAKRR
jgi:hypothetical protein